MSNALKKITAEAKRIRKQHPNKQWKDCVKAAGVKYRTGKISGVGKRAKKSAPKRRVAVVSGKPRVQVAANVGSVAMHKGAIASHYKVDLANTLLKRELATTKTERKKLSKKVSDIKRSLKYFA